MCLSFSPLDGNRGLARKVLGQSAISLRWCSCAAPCSACGTAMRGLATCSTDRRQHSGSATCILFAPRDSLSRDVRFVFGSAGTRPHQCSRSLHLSEEGDVSAEDATIRIWDLINSNSSFFTEKCTFCVDVADVQHQHSIFEVSALPLSQGEFDAELKQAGVLLASAYSVVPWLFAQRSSIQSNACLAS